jgi:hypothetical protein
MCPAGQPPVPLPSAVKRVPGWGGEMKTTGCGSHSSIGPPPTVHNTQRCPRVGQSIQVFRTDDGTRQRQRPGHLCPAPEGTCYLGSGWEGSLGREYVLDCCRRILPGCGASRPPIRQRDVGHLPADNGAIGGVPHQGRVAHGARHKPRRGPWKEWIYPKSEDVLKECGMKTIAEYVHIRRQTIAVYIATRPILLECRQGERQRGRSHTVGGGNNLWIWTSLMRRNLTSVAWRGELA